jgi:hypothetical protein
VKSSLFFRQQKSRCKFQCTNHLPGEVFFHLLGKIGKAAREWEQRRGKRLVYNGLQDPLEVALNQLE